MIKNGAGGKLLQKFHVERAFLLLIGALVLCGSTWNNEHHPGFRDSFGIDK